MHWNRRIEQKPLHKDQDTISKITSRYDPKGWKWLPPMSFQLMSFLSMCALAEPFEIFTNYKHIITKFRTVQFRMPFIAYKIQILILSLFLSFISEIPPPSYFNFQVGIEPGLHLSDFLHTSIISEKGLLDLFGKYWEVRELHFLWYFTGVQKAGEISYLHRA